MAGTWAAGRDAWSAGPWAFQWAVSWADERVVLKGAQLEPTAGWWAHRSVVQSAGSWAAPKAPLMAVYLAALMAS